MAYGMEAGYVPGGFEATVSAPGPAVQGNQDILDFLRQMQFRQQRSSRLARRPGLAQRPQVAPARVAAPAGEGDSSYALSEAEKRNRIAQIGEDTITRNMRKVPINTPGQSSIYGLQYDWDARSLTPGQVRAVSPQNASFEGAGAFNPTATPQGSDEDWAGFIRDLEARKQIGQYGSLAAASEAEQRRKLDEAAQRAALYGRF